MESWIYNIDSEVVELIREIGARIHAESQEVVAIAVALLAARMRVRVVEPERKGNG
jgi:hypothetical protein